MEDAYGAIGSERWKASLSRAAAIEAELRAMPDPVDILAGLSLYEKAQTILSSLAAFAKCTGAKDCTDPTITPAEGEISLLKARIESAAEGLFAAIGRLSDADPLWSEEPLAHWKFELEERHRSWKNRLSETDRAWLSDFETSVFLPLGSVFKSLQAKVKFPAVNSAGESVSISASRMVSVIKGDPDRALRKSVAEGLNSFYRKNADLYAALLNELHGFRLAAFRRAGIQDPLSVSLHQNRMSPACLNAIQQAIHANLGQIRRAVTLRAPFFGGEKLEVFDLMAPVPVKQGEAKRIPYAEGIAIVKESLASVHPEMAAFIDLMLEHGWVEAAPSDKKIGGAFYSHFNEFKIPRVFSSYTGSITAILQQGHELGHAFHYWQIRDLPVIKTEFPMTLTETASTFNEAVIRRHLFEGAGEAEQFAMLWQEARSTANFLLNTIVRMEFELAFLKEREKGVVPASKCFGLMEAAWREWYGDSTAETDACLWAYKLHYYKTDQFIYNYPYTVGYLLSQALMKELSERGNDFYPFYIALLRDTGRMTVDGIVKKHFKGDATAPAFWEGVLAPVFASIDLFSERAQRELAKRAA